MHTRGVDATIYESAGRELEGEDRVTNLKIVVKR